ncbi:hypothetical protein Tco_0449634 [Tanacetum coccineum]
MAFDSVWSPSCYQELQHGEMVIIGLENRHEASIQELNIEVASFKKYLKIVGMVRTWDCSQKNVIDWYGYVDLAEYHADSLYWDTWLPEEGGVDEFPADYVAGS